ncbi:hypothetical protein [Methylorubrum extorquens]|uniref:hypothetical protein n=1 Tax=Methylorubrum extorquens TaxID=408 RepID=UPI001EE518D8|nr:hypothetical protein [Methylorubrum extorquens]MCG5249623.1 hypothetical protein [Methylorubrum extorquens]
MPELPTVGELFKARAVTDEQVSAAVDTYLSDPVAGIFPIAVGYVVDLDAAVVDHPWASLVVANEDSSPNLKRSIVRMAILLARVQKA